VHTFVLTMLGSAALLSGTAVLQMLLARRSIRSRAEWGAIFLPSAAFFAMSLVILIDVGYRNTHSVREYVLITATLLLAAGSAVGVRYLLLAMRGQQARDDEIDFLRMRYERLFKDNEMPIVVFDRGSLKVVDVNGPGEDLFGRTRAELVSTPFDSLGFEQDVSAELARAETGGRRNVELRHSAPGGEARDLVIHLSIADVADARLVYGIVEDVTERNVARAELLEQKELMAHLADHDALTGLSNRRVLDPVLERAFARSLRDVPSALLFIDVDDFKQVNDVYGHQAGDVALTAISRLLERDVRAGDVVARQGGDEFAVLLESIDLDGAAAIAERLCVSVREHFPHLGLSIGAAPLVGASDTIEVVRRADECMYAAKSAGGNRVVVYSADHPC
jgi:diguanylate cyclase (GGDEF)-like protein/PAS domain S-box-containing protein